MAKTKQPTAELVVMQNPQILEVIQKSNLDLTKAEKYAAGYATLMGEVLAQVDIIKTLDKTNPEHAAVAKRASLDLGKICSKLEDKKKEDKATLLIETRLIDGLFNVAEGTGRLAQKDAADVFNYLDNLEKERKEKLADTRRVELESFEAVTTYLPLAEMTDEQYIRCLDDAKLAFEARKAAAELAEVNRIAAEQKAESDRLAAIEADRIAREQQAAENERLRKENDAKEAQLQKEREAAAAEQKRLSDVAEAERRVKQAELDKANAETARITKELADKKADEELAHEQERQRIESEAKEREAAAKSALLAPDKEKVRQLHTALKGIVIPDFSSKEGKEIGQTMREALDILIKGLVSDSKKLL